MNIGPIAIGLRPCDIREPPTYHSTLPQRHNVQGRNSIAKVMETRGRESVIGRSINQFPILLLRPKPLVQHGLQLHVVVLKDLRSREHVHQETWLEAFVVI